MSQVRVQVNDCIKNGRYRLTERLGGGMQGDVFLVADSNAPHSAKVAKICRKTALGKHEIEMLKKLSRSPFSVSFYEHFDLDADFCATITEDAGDSLEVLRKRKRGRRFNDQNVCKMVYDLVDGVERIHSAGYIHRDLHSHNVCARFINATARIYIIDYGLSLRTNCYASTRSHSHTLRNFAAGLQSSVAVMQGGRFEQLDDLFAIGYMALVLAGQQHLVHHHSPKTMLRRKEALDADAKKVLRPTRFMTAFFLELQTQKRARNGVQYDELREAILANKSCGGRKIRYRLEKVNGRQNFK